MINIISLIDPQTHQPFMSATAGDRVCYAIPHGRAFAVCVKGNHRRQEAVISVDGRNVLDNTPASPTSSGVLFTGQYICKGFQTSNSGARSFVHMPSGSGLLTAERAGAVDAVGVVAVATYQEEGRRSSADYLESHGGPVLRGVTRGTPRGGAMAGAEVSAPLGQTSWTRSGQPPEVMVVEYDTFEGWAARGVAIPRLSDANPWPGASGPRFADPNGL
jgi:hypothetical protein